MNLSKRNIENKNYVFIKCIIKYNTLDEDIACPARRSIPIQVSLTALYILISTINFVPRLYYIMVKVLSTNESSVMPIQI